MMRFHPLHGKNISLDENRLVATRINSFTHAMLFSERPMHAGELFVVEIEETTSKWSGHLKIGLTSIPPDEILERCTQEVVYDDIFYTTVPNRSVTQCPCTCGLYRPLFNIGAPDGEFIHTPFASISRKSIEPVRNNDNVVVAKCPTSVGGRVGVVYAFKQNTIHVHCILNGFDYGPFAILKIELLSTEKDDDSRILPATKRQRTQLMPMKQFTNDTKFWAFVDIYGATKKVRIVQLYGPSTLKSLCRSKILSNLQSHRQIGALPLGNRLKSFLKFCST